MQQFLCDVATRWPQGFVALVLWGACMGGARAQGASAAAPVGSLQRTAAAIDDSVDVYRLALIEIVPAMRLVAEAGQAPLADPASPIPPQAHETFGRLAASIERRIAADALAALPRAYHIEIVDALEALAGATRLDAIRLPARALTRALTQQAALAADVVDVFSRERPIVAEVLGPENALDTINDALGQLGLAEANIATIRDRKGTPGEQLQAFLRLEIALGRALDLIAAAEESGVHLGFEMPRATVGLASHLRQMQMRLARLEHVVHSFEQPPAASATDLRAEVHARSAGDAARDPHRAPGQAHPPQAEAAGAEVTFSWTPPEPGVHAPALLRLYTGYNALSAAVSRANAALCLAPADAAAALIPPGTEATATVAPNLTTDPNKDATHALRSPVEMAKGRSGAKLPWPPQTPDSSPDAPGAIDAATQEAVRYRLASVSAFGVEHLGPWIAPLRLPTELSPPSHVAATLSDTPYDSELFYHAAGSVIVTWQASPSDVAEHTRAQTFAKADTLPTVEHYAIFRVTGAHSELAGHVPQGVTRFVDRPALPVLVAGVRYVVVAMDHDGHTARPPVGCGQSAEVRADVVPMLRLAAAGAAALEHPTKFEMQYAQTLFHPTARREVQAAFDARPANRRQALWQRYWQGMMMSEKVRWHETWFARMNTAQQAARLTQWPQPVFARDQSFVQTALWTLQNPSYAQEPARYFALLTADDKRMATQAYRNALGPDIARAFDAAEAGSDAVQQQAWQQTLMQGIWFDSRDPEEQARLVLQLAQTEPAARATQRAQLWAAWPEALRRSVVWPPWESLSADERDAFLVAPPAIIDAVAVPDALWPPFLAWVAYAELDVDSKVDSIAQEVGLVTHAIHQVRYFVRPLDVRVGFKLWLYAALMTMGFVNGVLLRLVSRSLRSP